MPGLRTAIPATCSVVTVFSLSVNRYVGAPPSLRSVTSRAAITLLAVLSRIANTPRNRDHAPGRPPRPGVAQRAELVVGDLGADFAVGAVDPLLDLGQELVNQHRPGHPANSQAAISDGDVPGDGVM